MSDIIITIGRENGSGGREVGKIIADTLGIKYYDSEIIAATAKEIGQSEEAVAKEEERINDSHFSFWGVSVPDPVFNAQSKVIRNMAKDGSAVFVGRCADYILRDREDVVNVFVHAPMEDRVARSAKRNNISGEAHVPGYDIAPSVRVVQEVQHHPHHAAHDHKDVADDPDHQVQRGSEDTVVNPRSLEYLDNFGILHHGG